MAAVSTATGVVHLEYMCACIRYNGREDKLEYAKYGGGITFLEEPVEEGYAGVTMFPK